MAARNPTYNTVLHCDAGDMLTALRSRLDICLRCPIGANDSEHRSAHSPEVLRGGKRNQRDAVHPWDRPAHVC